MGKVIEIPRGKRTLRYRFFEILPFVLSVSMVALLPLLSWISPILGSLYLLTIVIMNLVKAVGIAYRMIQGQKKVKEASKIDWKKRCEEIDSAGTQVVIQNEELRDQYDFRAHLHNLQMVAKDPGN